MKTFSFSSWPKRLETNQLKQRTSWFLDSRSIFRQKSQHTDTRRLKSHAVFLPHQCCPLVLALCVCLILVSLPFPVRALIPEFLSYKTCADSPPSFSGCMTNVTADIGERVVLNCQVDPRCMIQYLHWYHEPDLTGEKRLLKTGRNSNDPYLHTIDRVKHMDFGRYVCVIANVVGETECAAFLSIKSGADESRAAAAAGAITISMLLLLKYC